MRMGERRTDHEFRLSENRRWANSHQIERQNNRFKAKEDKRRPEAQRYHDDLKKGNSRKSRNLKKSTTQVNSYHYHFHSWRDSKKIKKFISIVQMLSLLFPNIMEFKEIKEFISAIEQLWLLLSIMTEFKEIKGFKWNVALLLALFTVMIDIKEMKNHQWSISLISSLPVCTQIRPHPKLIVFIQFFKCLKFLDFLELRADSVKEKCWLNVFFEFREFLDRRYYCYSADFLQWRNSTRAGRLPQHNKCT